MNFEIHVKFRLNGVVCDFPLTVSHNTTFHYVKQICALLWGLSGEDYELVFDGIALSENDTMRTVGVEDGFQLDLARVTLNAPRGSNCARVAALTAMISN